MPERSSPLNLAISSALWNGSGTAYPPTTTGAILDLDMRPTCPGVPSADACKVVSCVAEDPPAVSLCLDPVHVCKHGRDFLLRHRDRHLAKRRIAQEVVAVDTPTMTSFDGSEIATGTLIGDGSRSDAEDMRRLLAFEQGGQTVKVCLVGRVCIHVALFFLWRDATVWEGLCAALTCALRGTAYINENTSSTEKYQVSSLIDGRKRHKFVNLCRFFLMPSRAMQKEPTRLMPFVSVQDFSSFFVRSRKSRKYYSGNFVSLMTSGCFVSG